MITENVHSQNPSHLVVSHSVCLIRVHTHSVTHSFTKNGFALLLLCNVNHQSDGSTCMLTTTTHWRLWLCGWKFHGTFLLCAIIDRYASMHTQTQTRTHTNTHCSVGEETKLQTRPTKKQQIKCCYKFMLWKRRTSFKMYIRVFFITIFWHDIQSSRFESDRLFDLKIQQKTKLEMTVKDFFSAVFHFLPKKHTHTGIIIWLVVYLKNSKLGSRSTLFIWNITPQRVYTRKKQKWKETHMRCFLDFALKMTILLSNRKLTFPTSIEPCNLIHRLFCNKNSPDRPRFGGAFVFTDPPNKKREREKWLQRKKTLFITLSKPLIPSCLCEKNVN